MTLCSRATTAWSPPMPRERVLILTHEGDVYQADI
jgi:hypothetical protein